ncbi:hypothetical protein GGX14DRAFT_382303, partial [Mycena pura]
LRQMFTRFLEGAKSTWIQFSSGLAHGGLIDGLGDDEKGRGWLPATNEGGLGSFIVYMRNNPTAVLVIHNGLAMLRNETEKIVHDWFMPEDHPYVMQTGLERKSKRSQMGYNQRILAEKAQKVATSLESF